MTSDMSSSMHSRRIGPHGTPESEFDIECFQNYQASEVFVQGLAGIVNQGDVEIMIRAQKQMLQRFEKTNEMLLNCNALSASRLKVAGDEFKKHTKLLSEMKKDLDCIFKKIRLIKTKLNSQYPQAFAGIQQERNSFAEEAEDAEEIAAGKEALSEVSTPKPKLKHQASEKKKSGESTSTVSYVKMDQSPDNGGKLSDHDKHQHNLIDKRRSFHSNCSSTENSNNSNDSSDCTSDTG